MITATQVKTLRDKTGAGVMDSKRALEEAGGDMDRATQLLAEKGLASAAKRSHRITSEGQIISYIHTGGRVGVMVEIKCETDFVGKTQEFADLGKNIAMQIAAMNPMYLDTDSVPDEVGEIPDNEILMLQEYIRDPSKNIGDLIKEIISKTGENIKINRYVRYELGD